ncbi:hypothetical protein MFRU_033g00650 [Monilinia fructicola]|uniref:Arginine biosynthesis bifunctional protein ArgJ, mitochondrial n=1 Tax=Monilinia fructicola TaxID=38448 RepID=A0A5M9K7D6_MONFR|nr:hypothetical protein EYC84_006136 [Monilinia fructicola]KAG4027095.1 hypothetical protein MFRU_033g00650 [Monilinia fructicola]
MFRISHATPPLRHASLRIRARAQHRAFTKFDSFGHAPVPANKRRFVPEGGTYPKGFRVGGIDAGIRDLGVGSGAGAAGPTQPDLVLVSSETGWDACGAAVLTKNEFPAASVVVTRELMGRSGGVGVRGVVANSWCANLLTGAEGLEDSRRMSREAGRLVGAEGEGQELMVMHTGMGGKRLPINKIIHSLPTLHQSTGNTHEHWLRAANGIRTTDTFPKLSSRTFTLPSFPHTTFSLAGITKGAGMIHPNMATTLGILCTDAPIQAPALQQLLRTAASKSYNCISIEGDTSTNDMVALFANGAAAPPSAPAITFDATAAPPSADFLAFQKILIEFMAELAKLVVRDGEGASKFITVRIRGAPSHAAGQQIAAAIARSVLFKTGVYGRDANPIGVLAALGYAVLGTEHEGRGLVRPAATSVAFVDGGAGEVRLVERGRLVPVDAARVRAFMAREDVEVVVDLRDEDGDGDGAGRERGEEAVYWTCDITHDFVTINGDFGN